MAHQGPRAGARGGLCPREEVEVEDWRMSSVCRGLHCCMVAPSAAQMGCSTKEAEEDLLGRVGPAQGEVVASCRTNAGAGFALALGDAARPERRDEDQGLRGTRVQERTRGGGKQKLIKKN